MSRTLAEELLGAWEAEGMRRGYRFLPEQFRQQVESHERTHGSAARARLLRDLLLHLVDRHEEIARRPLRLRLADSISAPLAIEHKRIRAEYADCQDEALLQLGSDIYLKDLGVGALKLIPAGAQLVDIQQGVPKSTVISAFRHSIAHGLTTARFLAFEHRGLQPALEIHTSLKNLGEFTPEGWRRCYGRIADLLKLNPHCLGMFGSSWFYDPALSTVTPRLAYLREEPAHQGAVFVHIGTDQDTTRNALATSESRRKLFEQGKYTPRGYMLIWARKQLLEYKMPGA